MRRLLRFLPVFIPVILTACSDSEFKPEELPIRFETVQELPGYAYDGDLDGNGSDEIFWVQNALDRYGAGRHLGYVRIDDLDGNVIAQSNFLGLIVTQSLHVLDYGRDGQQEILVPFITNDSLFVSFVNAVGQKLFHIFLIDGKPRKTSLGMVAWDPAVAQFYLADFDGDRKQELVTVFSTAFARLPRGVLVHTIPDGKLLGRVIIGAGMRSGIFDDFGGDQQPGFIVGTFASSNGASAGGYEDVSAYILKFDLWPSLRITWSRKMGTNLSSNNLYYRDFDGDGKKELLCFVTGGAPLQKAQMELIDPSTMQTKKQRTFNEPLSLAAVVDLDLDAQSEIIVSNGANELLVLDGKFEIKNRCKIPQRPYLLRALPDLDGDGVEDIFISTATQSFWLTPELGIKAIVPRFDFITAVQTGIGKKPYVLTTHRDRSTAKVTSTLLRQQENRFYLWYRYGPNTLKIISAGLVLALLFITVVTQRRNRRQCAIQNFITDTDSRALLLLNDKAKIVLVNAQWRQMIPMNNDKGHDSYYAKALAMPELVAFIGQALAPPERRHETTLAYSSDGRQLQVLVVIEPISIAKEKSSHWLVSVIDRAAETNPQQTQTWSLMAERVAHDLKSPLTSILLTLQRFQREYHAHSPQHAQTYDTYAANITDRIEALRRITRNFLKLVDVDQLHLVATDLNNYLQQAAKTISATLPPDIQCGLKLSAEPCSVTMDHEQMQVVLENLVANAVNAMPEGGKITLTASLVRNLHIPASNGNARDYAVFEVQDTGIGIPASAREHLFEPKFTTSENGTGLGLAMVKKIVTAHHGHVEFESEEGVGTVFSVYLPMG